MSLSSSVSLLRPWRPVRQALILAGGRGTRLGALTDATPKPLLPVGGAPFLAHVVADLARQGVTDIALSVGYRAEAIQNALGDGRALGVALRYVVEETPLGTGGAVKLAARGFREPFFVVNGDTAFDCPLQRLAMLAAYTDAPALLFCRHIEDAGRYGAVRLDPLAPQGLPFEGGRVAAFGEKSSSGPGLVNAGVYLLSPALADDIPQGVCSLEQDLFPALAAQGRLAGTPWQGFFLDMGLPESYAAAQDEVPLWRRSRERPCLLLDRDGALIVEKNYLHDPDEVVLLPGVPGALRAARDLGFLLAVVSNQAGVGRGYYSREDADRVNDRMASLLAAEGVSLDGVYYCPHAPEADCGCRKPRPGLLLLAAGELGFTPSLSLVIGDKACDVDLAIAVGAKGILVRTGYGKDEEQRVGGRAAQVTDDLAGAVAWLQRRN